MKIAKQAKAVLVVLIIASLLFSACKDKSALLVRTWKLENFKYSTEIPEEMKPQIQRSIDELKKSFTLTYYADGTYDTHMDNKLLRGKWKFDWTGSKIIATSEQGDTKTYTILTLTENDFEFKAVEGKDEVTFVMSAAK